MNRPPDRLHGEDQRGVFRRREALGIPLGHPAFRCDEPPRRDWALHARSQPRLCPRRHEWHGARDVRHLLPLQR